MRNQPVHQPDQALTSDGKQFWRSWYQATCEGNLNDSITVGPIACEPENRFHYNATENSIIAALARQFPFPPMRTLFPAAQRRLDWRVLDVGSGTGHWIDFYRDVYLATHVTGVEMVGKMAALLREKYDGKPVDIFQADIASPLPRIVPVDIVSAIGVMFHIVDDERWSDAIGNLSACLKTDGLMLVGGEFGAETKDVQFHKTDEFETWREHDLTKGPARLVNKRVRSFEHWRDAANLHGLDVVEVMRSECRPGIRTPENDVLVLRKR